VANRIPSFLPIAPEALRFRAKLRIFPPHCQIAWNWPRITRIHTTFARPNRKAPAGRKAAGLRLGGCAYDFSPATAPIHILPIRI